MEIGTYPDLQENLCKNKYEDRLYDVRGAAASVMVNFWLEHAIAINLDNPPMYSFKFFTQDNRVSRIIMYLNEGYVLNAGEGAETRLIYDNHNRIIDNGSVKFHYDTEGNRHTDGIAIEYTGNKITKVMVFYDNNDPDNPIQYIGWYKKYLHDPEGYIKTISYYAREPKDDADEDEYDEDRIITDIHDDGLQLRWVNHMYRSYDKNGCLTITGRNESDGTLSLTENTYDNYGNEVSSVVYKDGRPVIHYQCKYVYDEKGNWVKLTKYLVSRENYKNVIQVVFREITYL